MSVDAPLVAWLDFGTCLGNLHLSRLDTPLWMFIVFGAAATGALKRLHLGFLGRPVRRLYPFLDRLVMAKRVQLLSSAATHLGSLRRNETD